MSFYDLPPPAEIGADVKKAIIDGLRRAVEAFRREQLLDAAADYQTILHDPPALRGFVALCRQHPRLLDGIVKTAKGRPPTGDHEPLVCGVSLAQIEQLLVRTCAKRVFEKDRPAEDDAPEPKTTRRFLFFTKVEPVGKRPADPEERKARLIIENLAFEWQLPLLAAYKEAMSPQQLVELGGDLAAMRTPEAVRAAAAYDAATIRKARESAGRDLQLALAERPDAIPGIAYLSADMYVFFRNILGDQAFRFFARDRSFFNVVAGLDKPTSKVFGAVLCYIAAENLEEFQRLNIDKADVLLAALRQALGEAMEPALASPAFARDVLRRLVESIVHMRQDRDILQARVLVICQALAPQIREWLGRQRMEETAAGGV